MVQWLKWLNTTMVLFQDGWHACYISYSIESLNGTMVEMVEYHNGFLSQDG